MALVGSGLNPSFAAEESAPWLLKAGNGAGRGEGAAQGARRGDADPGEFLFPALPSPPLRSRSARGYTRSYLSDTRRWLSFVSPFSLPRWRTRCRQLEAITPGPSSPRSAPPPLPVPPGLPAASAAPQGNPRRRHRRSFQEPVPSSFAARGRGKATSPAAGGEGSLARGGAKRCRGKACATPAAPPSPFWGHFQLPEPLFSGAVWGACEVAFRGGSFLGSVANVSRNGTEKEALLTATRQGATRNKMATEGGARGEPRHF